MRKSIPWVVLIRSYINSRLRGIHSSWNLGAISGYIFAGNKFSLLSYVKLDEFG